jgi:SulP family sulfate permease
MISSKWHEFIPKSYLYLRKGYTLSSFKKDLLSGVTVGVIALPLAMAFAIASGVSPDKGLYTAIIAGFLISVLGGSRVQIGGPTGAFVVIVYGIIQRTGYQGLCLSTLIASLLLIGLGISRIGSWIKYVPNPLVTGFTSGIAVLIFSTQIKDFFGLQMGTPPAPFIEKWASYIRAFPSVQLPTFFLAVGSLLLIIGLKRFAKKIPWGIATIALGGVICFLFDMPVATIKSQFGEIPRSLPFPSFPSLSIQAGQFSEVFMNAVTIAFLGGIESLLSAVIGDGMIGGKHRSNCELVAQGCANIGSILFGGLPATGAIARTAANVKTGAQTPLAGMIHALTLLLILCFFAPLVSKIPLATLSAILIMVSWNMSEADHFIHLLKAPIGDRIILLTAFILTVFVDITAAIFVGMIIASFLFMKQMSQMSKAVSIAPLFQETEMDFPETNPQNLSRKTIPKGVEVYEIQGPFFFGTAHLLKGLPSPKIFILQMLAVPVIDASGMFALKEFYEGCKKSGTMLLLSGIHGQARTDLKRFGLIDLIKEENIFSDLNAALEKAEEGLKKT